MDQKRYATTRQAAEALGVHPTTLQGWARDGIVTPVYRTPGGRYRWDLIDLMRQLDRQPARGPAVPEATLEPSVHKPQRPAVITAIVTSPKGVLIGQRNDGKPPWTFIAGENEPGESPEDTIVREVKEETGLEILAGHIIGERVHPATGRHMVYVSARPRSKSTAVFVGDEEELAEVRWASLTEADQLLPGIFEPVRDYLAETIG